VRLILASASPRRAELLRSAGYVFDVHAVQIDESLRSGELPVEYVKRLAREKSGQMEELLKDAPAEAGQSALKGLSKAGQSAPKGPAKAGPHVLNQPWPGVASGFSRSGDVIGVASGFSRTTDVIILGADTAVVVGDSVLGKPHDAEDAARMLRRLSGRSHEVMTGVCLRTAGRRVSHVEISTVTFATLTEDQIAWYVASGEGHDKAGGYAIQGLASRFIPRIEGSYSNVVGLPIAVVDDLIQRLTSGLAVLASEE
jgi:septum formation protein